MIVPHTNSLHPCIVNILMGTHEALALYVKYSANHSGKVTYNFDGDKCALSVTSPPAAAAAAAVGALWFRELTQCSWGNKRRWSHISLMDVL